MKPLAIVITIVLIIAAGIAIYAAVPLGRAPFLSAEKAATTTGDISIDAMSQAFASAATGTIATPDANQTAAAKVPVPSSKQASSGPAVQTQPSASPQQQSQSEPALQTPPQPVAAATSSPAGDVCNTALIGTDGYDAHHMISKAACEKLNQLYAAGKAAGNIGDLYDNRDGLHVNLCVDWSPNPNCPIGQRLFMQHGWQFSGAVGRATSPFSQPTIGQASWSGTVEGDNKRSIPYDMYGSQAGADTLYNLYIHNNLYVYPSLYDDSFKGSPYDAAIMGNPVTTDPASANRANTPYAIASKQICDCGAGSLRIHDASGSDLPFVELGFAGLAAFQPSVKAALIQNGMLMPTLQALIRYSYRSVDSSTSYLASAVHRGSYMAHYLDNGSIKPQFDALRLVDLASGLSAADVPPLVELSVSSETFTSGEKLFDTPGAIARSVALGTPARSITVSADGSKDMDGTTSGHEFAWRVVTGDSSLVSISVNPTDSGTATLTFAPGPAQRIDVGVFVRKAGGAYYSVPGIVSEYIHP